MRHSDPIDRELHDMIDDIVDAGMLKRGTPAFWIAQQVIYQGLNSLSPKQRSVYDSAVPTALMKRGDELKNSKPGLAGRSRVRQESGALHSTRQFRVRT
jgi:hypothetical protein